MAAWTRRIGSAVLLTHFVLAPLAAATPGHRTGSGERLGPDAWEVESVAVALSVPLAASPSRVSLGASRAELLAPFRGGFDPYGSSGSASGDRSGSIRASPEGRKSGPELRPGDPVLAAAPEGVAVEALSRLHRARLGRLSSPSTAPPAIEPSFTLG